MVDGLHRLVVEKGELPDLNWAEWIRGESPFVTAAMANRRRAEAENSLHALAGKVPLLAAALAEVDQESTDLIAETPDVALWTTLMRSKCSDSLRKRAVEIAGEQPVAAVTAAARRAVFGARLRKGESADAGLPGTHTPSGVLPFVEWYVPPDTGTKEVSSSFQLLPIIRLGPSTEDCLAINPFYLGLRHPLPGLEPVERILDSPTTYLIAQNLLATCELIGFVTPGYRQEAATLLRYGVPLNPSPTRIYSGSNTLLPGAFFFAGVNVPGLLAEMLLHEAAHAKLFLLQRWDLLTTGKDGGWEDCSFYSPWREDLRPLQGVVHGAFVYTHLALFWSSIAEARAAELFGIGSSLAARRAATAAAEVMFAVEEIEGERLLTAWGGEILTTLWQECSAVLTNLTGGALGRTATWSPHRDLQDKGTPTVLELLNHHYAASRKRGRNRHRA
jgi:hypothetical protein